MKIQVNKSELLSAINTCSKATGRTIIPALENFKISVDGNKMTIIASTMEIYISSVINCESDIPGSFLIDHAKFSTLIRSLDDKLVSISVNDTIAEIKSKSGKYKIPVENSEDFPTMPEPNTNEVKINSDKIYQALDRAIFASVKEYDSRGFSNINMEFNQCGLIVTGASHHIISTVKVSESDFSELNLNLPNKSVSTILPLIQNSELLIKSDDKNVSFEFDNNKIVLSLKNNVFPNYKSVLPESNKFVASVSSDLLAQSIKRVGIFANKDTEVVKLIFSENKLVLSAVNSLLNEEGSEEIDCQYSGEEMEILLKGPQIQSTISKINSENVFVHFTDPMRSVIFRDNSNQSLDDLILLAPCKA